MNSAFKYFFFILIIGFALTAKALDKYNLGKKHTKEEK